MLGLGWSEMLVIAVVVLIVVGPKDLPVMLRNLGRMMGSVRRMSNDFRREIDKAIAADEIKEAKKALSDPLKQTTADITKEFNSIRDGKVEPSGKLKPSAEGQESVYEEIRAQAGMDEGKAGPSAASASIRAKVAEQQARAKVSATAGEVKPAPVRAAAKPRTVATRKSPAKKATAPNVATAKTTAKPKKVSAPKTEPSEPSDNIVAARGEAQPTRAPRRKAVSKDDAKSPTKPKSRSKSTSTGVDS